MPIIKSAKKALRQSIKRKATNDRRTKAMKDAIKKVEKSAKDKKAEAIKLLPSAFAAIDKAAKRGVIKKNTAARKKARLARITKDTK
jgi:small subunit ribosomal protein S20